MSNITDYISWRGDISFKVNPFNHVDSLVLCQLMYANVETIIPHSFSDRISLKQLSCKYFESDIHQENLGALINENTADFLKNVGNTERFSGVTLCGFTNIIDYKLEAQFAAMCAILPTGEVCIIFRGTDDTLIGWKEDFNMSHTFPVPSQTMALDYLQDAFFHLKKRMYVMGHSKGGNLAVYASAFCDAKVSKKIISIFDNDGPGFLPEVYNKHEFNQISSKIITVIPESSVVGILLKKVNTPRFIVSSETSGISQHDIFSWQIECTTIIAAKSQNQASILAAKTVETWLSELEVDERKKFVQEFFKVLAATDASTLLELKQNWLHCSVAVLKTMSTLDKHTKDQIYKIIMLFFKALHVNLPPIKDFFLHD